MHAKIWKVEAGGAGFKPNSATSKALGYLSTVHNRSFLTRNKQTKIKSGNSEVERSHSEESHAEFFVLPHCVLCEFLAVESYRVTMQCGERQSCPTFCSTAALWKSQSMTPVPIVIGLLAFKSMKNVKNSEGTVQP